MLLYTDMRQWHTTENTLSHVDQPAMGYYTFLSFYLWNTMYVPQEEFNFLCSFLFFNIQVGTRRYNY